MYDIKDEKFNSWKKEKVPLLFDMIDRDISRDGIGVFLTALLECAYVDGYKCHKAEIEKMLLERVEKAEKELAASKREEEKLTALHDDLTKRVNALKTPERL